MKSKKFIISSAIAVTAIAGGTTYALVDRNDEEPVRKQAVAQQVTKEEAVSKEITTPAVTTTETNEQAPVATEEPVVVDNTNYIAEKLASVGASAMKDKFNTILSMQNPNYLTADKSFIDDVFAVATNPDFSFMGRGQMTGQISTCISSKQPVLCINATHHYLHFAGSPKLDDLR